MTDSKDFIHDIKSNPLYKRAFRARDKEARNILAEEKEKNTMESTKSAIFPGQLVLFKYLTPKTLEELEYYDASPLTIFFGIFNSKNGKRVLGFNVHYFPPAIRYNIMAKIFELYRPVYKKYFETGLPKDIDAFDYKFLIDELSKHNLSFAVREYIPALIGDTNIIAPKNWSTAMFTEGWFRKETRAMIMSYFKSDAKKKHKISTGTHSKGKAGKKKK